MRLTALAFLALAACGPQTPLPHVDGNNAPETRPLTPVDVNNAIDRALRPMPRPER
jgi:predicted small lipoprotein YifL